MRSKIIYNMTFPHIWLAIKNIKNFKWGNFTQYLILEGLDAIRQVTFLVDVEISTLDEPLEIVWMWMCCCWKFQSLHDLC
jgi:hypothetical protein